MLQQLSTLAQIEDAKTVAAAQDKLSRMWARDIDAQKKASSFIVQSIKNSFVVDHAQDKATIVEWSYYTIDLIPVRTPRGTKASFSCCISILQDYTKLSDRFEEEIAERIIGVLSANRWAPLVPEVNVNFLQYSLRSRRDIDAPKYVCRHMEQILLSPPSRQQ